MVRIFSVTVAVASAALLPLDAAWAQVADAEYRHGPWMMWDEGGWMMMIFGPVFMIAALAAAIAGGVLLVRWLGGIPRGGPAYPAATTPLDILKERFAKGEIDATEFEDRRRVLGE